MVFFAPPYNGVAVLEEYVDPRVAVDIIRCCAVSKLSVSLAPCYFRNDSNDPNSASSICCGFLVCFGLDADLLWTSYTTFDLLYGLLCNKFTTDRRSGIWANCDDVATKVLNSKIEYEIVKL